MSLDVSDYLAWRAFAHPMNALWCLCGTVRGSASKYLGIVLDRVLMFLTANYAMCLIGGTWQSLLLELDKPFGICQSHAAYLVFVLLCHRQPPDRSDYSASMPIYYSMASSLFIRWTSASSCFILYFRAVSCVPQLMKVEILPPSYMAPPLFCC